MGEFRYICSECEGEECGHGGQHEYQPAYVVVELPLSDGTTVHVKGCYEGYGYVVIKLNKETTYEFYLEQFREYFRDWLINENEEYRSSKYLCTKIYTSSEKQDASNINENARPGQTITIDYNCANGKQPVKFTKKILSKCIRADEGLNLPNYLDYLVEQTEIYKKEILEITPKLEELKQKLLNITETPEYKKQVEIAKENIKQNIDDFKDYLDRTYVSWHVKTKFDKWKRWTDSEKEEIEKLKKLVEDEKYDEYDKEFEVFRQNYLAKDLSEKIKKGIIEEASLLIKREIYEQEHELNWRKYSTRCNEESIQKEKRKRTITSTD